MDVMEVNEEVVAMKSTFDRFGDHLMQEILSYWTTEEKLRFECLNKRVKALIFENRSLLHIENGLISRLVDNTIKINESEYHFLEKCLRKLKYFSEIFVNKIPVNGMNLKTLTDNCLELTRLDIHLSRYITLEDIEYFGERCGQNIKDLVLYSNDEDMIASLLSYTQRLLSLKVCSLKTKLLLKANGDKLLPKLRAD